MKKKIVLISSLPLLAFSLFSCQKSSKFNLDFGNIHSSDIQSIYDIKELKYEDLKSLINNKTNFMVALYYSGCGCWDSFNPVLKDFVNKYHIDVPYIEVDEFEGQDSKFGLYTVKGDMPSIAFFKRGKLVKQVIYQDKTREYFKILSSFEDLVLKNVNLPKTYYLDKDVLDTYIADNKEFDLYIARSECGDCKSLNSTVFASWSDKYATVTNKLYIFDIQKWHPGKRPVQPKEPAEDATPEEKAQYIEDLAKYEADLIVYNQKSEDYQEIKDKYGLTTKYNPTFGYDLYGGAVPTFQHRQGDEIVDMVTALNDQSGGEEGNYKITTSYFTEAHVSKMTFLGKDTKYVLQDKSLTSTQKERWYVDAMYKLHKPLIEKYFAYYLK